MKNLLLPLLFSWSLPAFSQASFPVQDSVYLFWQEGTRINYQDYQGPSFPNKIPVVAEIAVWTVLDLPDNQELSASKPIRYYIAPLCDRKLSHADTNDPALIEMDNIYFDIGELCARTARKKLAAIRDSLISEERASATFKAIVKEMHEKRLKMNRELYRDYYRYKYDKALLSWRNKLDKELAASSSWATRPEECYRFILGKPIEPGYKEDLRSNAVVILDKYEQVLAKDTWHAGFNQPSRQRAQKK